MTTPTVFEVGTPPELIILNTDGRVWIFKLPTVSTWLNSIKEST